MPVAESRPKYPIPWIATYVLTALVLIAGSFFMVWYLGRIGNDYDRYDPDFEFLSRIARSAKPREGDFSNLNGGDWTALCLVGAGGDVERALQEGKIAALQASALRAAFGKEQTAPHKTEFTLAYVNRAGAAKRLRHPHGFAFAREGMAKCTDANTPVVALPVGLVR